MVVAGASPRPAGGYVLIMPALVCNGEGGTGPGKGQATVRFMSLRVTENSGQAVASAVGAVPLVLRGVEPAPTAGMARD